MEMDEDEKLALEHSPEIASMIWEYRLHNPDPYFLSEILLACAGADEKVPIDLLQDAASMVLPERDKIPDRTKRKKQFDACRAVWGLHFVCNLPLDKELFDRVGHALGRSGSAIRDIWYKAPDLLRKSPPLGTSSDVIARRLLEKYPEPPD